MGSELKKAVIREALSQSIPICQKPSGNQGLRKLES